MSNLQPERAWQIYLARMKIEQAFHNLKGLLGLTCLMNQQPDNMEKMVAILLLVYAITLWIGENPRDRLHGEMLPQPDNDSHANDSPSVVPHKIGKKWRLYSGLLILLKQK